MPKLHIYQNLRKRPLPFKQQTKAASLKDFPSMDLPKKEKSKPVNDGWKFRISFWELDLWKDFRTMFNERLRRRFEEKE